MEDPITHLASRIRCLEIQAATFSGLHDAYSAMGSCIQRRDVFPLLVDRLHLVMSVAGEVWEAIEDCVSAEIPLSVVALFETLAWVRMRLPSAAPGMDTRPAMAALFDARFAVLAGSHQLRRRA